MEMIGGEGFKNCWGFSNNAQGTQWPPGLAIHDWLLGSVGHHSPTVVFLIDPGVPEIQLWVCPCQICASAFELSSQP